MKQPKRIVSVILTVIAIACILTAGILSARHIRQDRRSEDILEELRASAAQTPESDPPSGSGSDKAPDTCDESVPTKPLSSESEAAADTGSDTAGAEQPSKITADAPQADEPAADEPTADQPVAVPNPYTDSFLANPDMAAWLQIPGTDIDYPVMWTPEDDTYYLYRDFEGNKNQNGCLLLDEDSCPDPLTTNLLIHGHNMKSGAMFGNLTDYEKESFYEDHKKIILYTKECRRNYEVIAVFRSQVYKKTDQVFKFYQFFQADTEEEFDYFYQNIKELSQYDTGVTAEFGDRFITLSTCVYHVTNGRFVVVAKEVEPDEYYLPVTEEADGSLKAES